MRHPIDRPGARSRPAFALLCACLALAPWGCSRCGHSEKARRAPISALLPRDADAVVILPDLDRIGPSLARLQRLRLVNFVAQLEGFRGASAWADAWVSQLGIDPRSPEALKRVGIDPSRGFGLALFARSKAGPAHSYAVVGLDDAGRFREALTALAKRRLGATVRARTQVNGLTLTTWSEKGSAVPALGELEKNGFALVARGADVKQLGRLAKLPADRALSSEKDFTSARTSLGAPAKDGTTKAPPIAPLAWIHLRKGSAWGDPRLSPEGLTAALTVSSEGLSLRAVLPWSNPAEVAALRKVSSEDLTGQLPATAFLIARAQVDPSRWKGLWGKWVPRRVAAALAQSGLDVDEMLLANAKPGAVLGISLSPSLSLASGLSSFDPQRADPFHALSLVALDGVRKPATAQAALEKIAANAGHFGAQMEQKAIEGQQVFVSRYALGEGLSFAVRDGKLLAMAPRKALRARLARQGAVPNTELPKSLKAALDGQALAAGVDLRKLSGALSALPSSAWGVGGFAIKMAVVRWLGALDELKSASFGVRGERGALRATLRIRWTAR